MQLGENTGEDRTLKSVEMNKFKTNRISGHLIERNNMSFVNMEVRSVANMDIVFGLIQISRDVNTNVRDTKSAANAAAAFQPQA